MSYLVSISRSAEQLCYFVQIVPVWLTSSVVQTTWTTPRLKMSISHSSPTNSVNIHVSLMLESATLGTDLTCGLTSTTPPSNCQLYFGKDCLACSQQSSVQGYTADCCSACCTAGLCRPFLMLGIGWPSDL